MRRTASLRTLLTVLTVAASVSFAWGGRSGRLTYQHLDPSRPGTRDAEIDVSGSACP